MKEKFTANAKLHNSNPNPNPNPNIVKWSVLYLTNYACSITSGYGSISKIKTTTTFSHSKI